MKEQKDQIRKRTDAAGKIALAFLLSSSLSNTAASSPSHALEKIRPDSKDVRTQADSTADGVIIIDNDVAPPAVPARAPKHGRSRVKISVDGIQRSYRLYIPKAFSREKHCPLIIVLHGGGGDARSAEWDSVMSKQAEKDNFIVAYPNGFMRTWNAGRCCGMARVQNIDDVKFIRLLIEKLKEQLGLDPDRIYVTGLSNGGMLAYRVGSELTDTVAAIAPVEGCMYELNQTATAPMNVIAFHGMEDCIVRYNGGTGWILGYSLEATPVAPTIEYWIKRNQCDTTAIREEKGPLIKELYTNGKDGTEVCLYTLKDGGHAWPGGRRASILFDKPRKYISATEVMCEFFWAHPRNRAPSVTGNAIID